VKPKDALTSLLLTTVSGDDVTDDVINDVVDDECSLLEISDETEA